MEMLAKGSAETFNALLEPVLAKSYAMAYHMSGNKEEAEDLVQEAALLAFRGFGSFQLGTNFKAWFFRIVVNCAHSLHRKRQREPKVTALEDAEDLYLYTHTAKEGLHRKFDNPAELVLDRMSIDQIKQAIESLPFDYRLVCALYFLEEISYQEIADIIDIPVGTVRSRLHRGRKLLQKSLWDLAVENNIVQSLKEESGALR